MGIRERQWEQLSNRRRGSNDETSRSIKVDRAYRTKQEHQFPRFFRDPKIDPALKWALLRWCVYRFPVRYKESRVESSTLHKLRDTDSLSPIEYEGFVETMSLVFNKEQEEWGLWKLRSSYVADFRARHRED